MSEIRTLSDLEKIIDSKTIDNIFMEYVLLLKGKADVLDRINAALDRKNTTVEDIRIIAEGTDDTDYMV